MRLIAITLARNEADVIEAFVRHHVALLDALVVVNHGSSDGTLAILRELAREGLPLVVLNDTHVAFEQGTRTGEVMRRALRELDADFAFALDADELLRAPSRAALEAELARCGQERAGVVPWLTYVPTAVDQGHANPLVRIAHRVEREVRLTPKVAVPRTFERDASLAIEDGNHAVVRPGGPGRGLVVHERLAGVELAHFPIRSTAQLVSKIVLGRLALGPGDGGGGAKFWHWKELYTRLHAGEAFTPEKLGELALRYYVWKQPDAGPDWRPPQEIALVRDPMPARELRYGELAQAPLDALPSWASELIRRTAQQVTIGTPPR